MAQTNFTPISLYYSTTASAAPTAGNLVAGELAINTNDGKLFYKDSSGVVQTIATKATAALPTTTTGSGNIVLSTSPTLVTPVLGTPTSGNLANCTFPAGTVIQVVGANNTMSNTTITSTSAVSLGLTASITPKFNTSKIYIMATFSMTQDGLDNAQSSVYIYRGATNLRGGGTCLAMYDTAGGDVGFSIPTSFYDSPATTSATSYTIYGSVSNASSQFRPRSGTDTIILMEVAQ